MKVLLSDLVLVLAFVDPARQKGSLFSQYFFFHVHWRAWFKFRDNIKRIGSKFVPDHSKKGIDEILNDVETSVRSFADSLQLARDQYMVDMGHGMETIQTDVTRLGQSLAELNKGHKDRLSKQWERHEPN